LDECQLLVKNCASAIQTHVYSNYHDFAQTQKVLYIECLRVAVHNEDNNKSMKFKDAVLH